MKTYSKLVFTLLERNNHWLLVDIIDIQIETLLKIWIGTDN